MGKSRLPVRILFWGTSFVVATILVFLFAVSFYIELRVQRSCEIAATSYQGDEIQALIAMIKDEDGCSKQKARALWTLGQLGNKRALPFLRVNYGDREEDDLCIHEGQFAILKIEEERFNLPGFLWRGLLGD